MRRTAALLTAVVLLALGGCGTGGVSLPNSQAVDNALIYPDDNNEAYGYMGDTLRTSFFDLRLNDAYTCREYGGVTADEGNKLLVAEITLYNYTDYTQPMYFYDFELYWDGEEITTWTEEEYVRHLPVFREEVQSDGSSEYYSRSDLQLPAEYDLSIRETREGILLYQVPEESKTYSIIFQEYFSDDTEGALFEVRFSAPLTE